MSPANHRAYLKRYADEAMNDLKRASEGMIRLAAEYGEIHPEYNRACLQINEMIETTAQFLAKFRSEFI